MVNFVDHTASLIMQTVNKLVFKFTAFLVAFLIIVLNSIYTKNLHHTKQDNNFGTVFTTTFTNFFFSLKFQVHLLYPLQSPMLPKHDTCTCCQIIINVND